MAPKRSSSAKPSTSASRAKSPSPSPKKSAAASPKGRKSAIADEPIISAAASSTRTSTIVKEPSVIPEKKAAAGFFDEADRVYDRSTTRMLNDLAGFIVIVVGMIYFTLSGYFLYRETYGIPISAAGTGSQ